MEENKKEPPARVSQAGEKSWGKKSLGPKGYRLRLTGGGGEKEKAPSSGFGGDLQHSLGGVQSMTRFHKLQKKWGKKEKDTRSGKSRARQRGGSANPPLPLGVPWHGFQRRGGGERAATGGKRTRRTEGRYNSKSRKRGKAALN